MEIDMIDTRHGTLSTPELSNGNTLPLTGVPFGTNYYAVQTSEGRWWFDPKATIFSGIRLTHQASPWMGDYCYLRFLPLANDDACSSAIYDIERSVFNPAQLQVSSELNTCVTKLVPTDKGALVNIDYAGSESLVKFYFEHTEELKWTEDEVSGVIYQDKTKYSNPLKMYFVLEFSEKFTAEQNGVELLLDFDKTNHLEFRIGTSYIGFDYARKNLPTEADEVLLSQAIKVWNDKLGKIDVRDSNVKNVKTFYHNFYRCFLFPQRAYEVDKTGQPIHYDMYTDVVKKGYLYVNTGFWDTAKTIFPLYTLIETEELSKMADGFLNSYRESGYLPKWLAPEEKGAMPGTMVDTVIADWVAKDLFADKWEELLEGMINSAENASDRNDYGRIHIEEYKKFGYVSANRHESVNHTLDYSYSDFCIAKVAEKLSMKDIHEKYYKRSENFVNLFDEKNQFIVPREENGEFVSDFSPIKWGDGYAESSAWQSGFLIFHDVQKLINCFGEEKFEDRLIEMGNSLPSYKVGSYQNTIHEMVEMAQNDFGQLNVGNQPGFHLPYLNHFIGKPEYAQPVLKQMMEKLFDYGVNGYPGDEDNGSMSAWFVFNSLGFYPYCPGSGEYLIGMPLFEEAVIHFENGRELQITTNQNSGQHLFINGVQFNDQDYKISFFKHNDISSGGQLHFRLGCVPNHKAFDSTVRPYSLSNEAVRVLL